jgi:hypothetical protein
MALRTPYEIWYEQFDAAESIKLRYGVKSAFEYIVGEKLLNFADASAERPEFAREFPQFVAAVRNLFEIGEMIPLLNQMEEELESQLQFTESSEDEFSDYETKAAKARLARFSSLRELLTAATLGTS